MKNPNWVKKVRPLRKKPGPKPKPPQIIEMGYIVKMSKVRTGCDTTMWLAESSQSNPCGMSQPPGGQPGKRRRLLSSSWVRGMAVWCGRRARSMAALRPCAPRHDSFTPVITARTVSHERYQN